MKCEVDGEDLHDHVLLCVRKEQFHLDSSPSSQGAHGLHGFFFWHTKSVPENVGAELLRRIWPIRLWLHHLTNDFWLGLRHFRLRQCRYC